MIRAWICDGEGPRPAAPEEAVQRALGDGRCGVWIDFDGEAEPVARRILEPLGIHPLVLEDMVLEINRPKVDNYGEYVYLVLHSARWDADRPALREIDFVVGGNYLITYRDGETRSIRAAHETVPRRPDLLSNGPAPLLHFILDVLVDHYLPIMDRIGEAIDVLEEQVFDERHPIDHRQVIGLKRGMSALRRIVGPQRDTVLALTRDEFKPIPPSMRPYLRDVYDRIARTSDLLDSFRDESATVLELHLTMASNRLNEVIKRLTVIATVGIPLTVITGYYGMNVALPEFKWPWGWVFVLALLVASVVGTLVVLRRRNWW